MPIVYKDWITRDFIRANPEAVFVFGDNVDRKGLGGQAREMRGEPNTIGIATKWYPSMEEQDFFSDEKSVKMSIRIIFADLTKVTDALSDGKTVYVPSAGLGTGLSQLPTRAPKLYKLIKAFFTIYGEQECPWKE
jgi:hypothetical protein